MLSGREDSCFNQTKDWLEFYEIPYDRLLMRSDGDNRKDDIIKKEIFDKYIKDKLNVHFVLDDRNFVIKMWRSMGIPTLQVNYGDF